MSVFCTVCEIQPDIGRKSPFNLPHLYLAPPLGVTLLKSVEVCIQQLGQVEEMAFAARRSYASAVLGVLILSICHMCAL